MSEKLKTAGSILLYRFKVFLIVFLVIMTFHWIGASEWSLGLVNLMMALGISTVVYGLAVLAAPGGARQPDRHERRVHILTGFVVLVLSVPMFFVAAQTGEQEANAMDALYDPTFGDYIRTHGAQPSGATGHQQDKLVVYMQDTGHWNTRLIPPELRAEKAEDVGAILTILREDVLVGHYGPGVNGYRIDYHAALIDAFDYLILGKKTFSGGYPSQYGGSGHSYGSTPRMEDMREWIERTWEQYRPIQ